MTLFLYFFLFVLATASFYNKPSIIIKYGVSDTPKTKTAVKPTTAPEEKQDEKPIGLCLQACDTLDKQHAITKVDFKQCQECCTGVYTAAKECEVYLNGDAFRNIWKQIALAPTVGPYKPVVPSYSPMPVEPRPVGTLSPQNTPEIQDCIKRCDERDIVTDEDRNLHNECHHCCLTMDSDVEESCSSYFPKSPYRPRPTKGYTPTQVPLPVATMPPHKPLDCEEGKKHYEMCLSQEQRARAVRDSTYLDFITMQNTSDVLVIEEYAILKEINETEYEIARIQREIEELEEDIEDLLRPCTGDNKARVVALQAALIAAEKNLTIAEAKAHVDNSQCVELENQFNELHFDAKEQSQNTQAIYAECMSKYNQAQHNYKHNNGVFGDQSCQNLNHMKNTQEEMDRKAEEAYNSLRVCEESKLNITDGIRFFREEARVLRQELYEEFHRGQGGDMCRNSTVAMMENGLDKLKHQLGAEKYHLDALQHALKKYHDEETRMKSAVPNAKASWIRAMENDKQALHQLSICEADYTKACLDAGKPAPDFPTIDSPDEPVPDGLYLGMGSKLPEPMPEDAVELQKQLQLQARAYVRKGMLLKEKDRKEFEKEKKKADKLREIRHKSEKIMQTCRDAFKDQEAELRKARQDREDVTGMCSKNSEWKKTMQNLKQQLEEYRLQEEEASKNLQIATQECADLEAKYNESHQSSQGAGDKLKEAEQRCNDASVGKTMNEKQQLPECKYFHDLQNESSEVSGAAATIYNNLVPCEQHKAQIDALQKYYENQRSMVKQRLDDAQALMKGTDCRSAVKELNRKINKLDKFIVKSLKQCHKKVPHLDRQVAASVAADTKMSAAQNEYKRSSNDVQDAEIFKRMADASERQKEMLVQGTVKDNLSRTVKQLDEQRKQQKVEEETLLKQREVYMQAKNQTLESMGNLNYQLIEYNTTKNAVVDMQENITAMQTQLTAKKIECSKKKMPPEVLGLKKNLDSSNAELMQAQSAADAVSKQCAVLVKQNRTLSSQLSEALRISEVAQAECVKSNAPPIALNRSVSAPDSDYYGTEVNTTDPQCILFTTQLKNVSDIQSKVQETTENIDACREKSKSTRLSVDEARDKHQQLLDQMAGLAKVNPCYNATILEQELNTKSAELDKEKAHLMELHDNVEEAQRQHDQDNERLQPLATEYKNARKQVQRDRAQINKLEEQEEHLSVEALKEKERKSHFLQMPFWERFIVTLIWFSALGSIGMLLLAAGLYAGGQVKARMKANQERQDVDQRSDIERGSESP